MPTIARTLELAPVACYLSANFVAKRGLFGGSVDASNPLKIYNVYKILKEVYDHDNEYDGLQVRCDYLYELMKRWALAAAAIVDGGGGGSVSPVTPPSTGNQFPIVVTGSDFEVDGVTYNNPILVGNNLMLFVLGFNSEWQFSPAFFNYTATGIQITFPSFNANDYTSIIIQNFNP